jgi:hypothetical protein
MSLIARMGETFYRVDTFFDAPAFPEKESRTQPAVNGVQGFGFAAAITLPQMRPALAPLSMF